MPVGISGLGSLAAARFKPRLLGGDGDFIVARQGHADLGIALCLPACGGECFFRLGNRHAADIDAAYHHVRVNDGGLADDHCTDKRKRGNEHSDQKDRKHGSFPAAFLFLSSVEVFSLSFSCHLLILSSFAGLFAVKLLEAFDIALGKLLLFGSLEGLPHPRIYLHLCAGLRLDNGVYQRV